MADWIYRSGLILSTGTGPGVLLVDTTTLITLAKADIVTGTETSNLDLLLASGRQIVITSTVLGEATAGVGQGFADSIKIDNWIATHSDRCALTRASLIPPLGLAMIHEASIQGSAR